MDTEESQERIERLERRIDQLLQKLDALKSRETIVTDDTTNEELTAVIHGKSVARIRNLKTIKPEDTSEDLLRAILEELRRK